ncbi:Pentatricopeptide repeat-containing protein [Acorus calamus]|uniref:Pentatricopeptide repeat-containing protein n=1 Tax=Acorus calamus TaxID=4465 RepID=A0AAV9EF71_ACOCL|nr:Pentatricopeptide repeat-containing protein [Acorus calamus]
MESYKLLICGFCEDGDVIKAKLVFHSLLNCGYNNDEIAWKILIDGLLKSGHVNQCSELLVLMEGKNCQPSPQTYDTLIKEFVDRSNGA